MKDYAEYRWVNIGSLVSHSYVCGHCSQPLASKDGFTGYYEYYTGRSTAKAYAYIYICHFCHQPTFFCNDFKVQIPGTSFGIEVNDIEDLSVKTLYEEARRATSTNCYTSAVLACRKLLMHIAVSKGADSNKSFAYYVDYLSEKNFVPPGAISWIDHIRKIGNQANHEIAIIEPDDAKELLEFVGMLLKIIYEFPAIVRKKTPPKEK